MVLRHTRQSIYTNGFVVVVLVFVFLLVRMFGAGAFNMNQGLGAVRYAGLHVNVFDAEILT
jgi:hypothetical protein